MVSTRLTITGCAWLLVIGCANLAWAGGPGGGHSCCLLKWCCCFDEHEERESALHRHWRRLEPPRGAVVYSVPAAMVAQQALAVDPRQFRSFALDCRNGERDNAADEKLAEQFRALAERLERTLETEEPQREPTAPGFEDRIEALESRIRQLKESEPQVPTKP
ncbi:MAG: hypothetical protein KY476_16810 [Planctomycetes bacterium]|nr:hypothetical protein [Planctomycetota bacterium]